MRPSFARRLHRAFLPKPDMKRAAVRQTHGSQITSRLAQPTQSAHPHCTVCLDATGRATPRRRKGRTRRKNKSRHNRGTALTCRVSKCDSSFFYTDRFDLFFSVALGLEGRRTILWNARVRQFVCGFSVPNETVRRISNQKTISAPSVRKERPGTYSESGQAKIPQIKNTPRPAKRASSCSPRRTRRSKWAQIMFCAYAWSIDVRTFAWIIRRQAKSHAAIRMRDCSSSKSLRMAICIRSIRFGPICTMHLSMVPK